MGRIEDTQLGKYLTFLVGEDTYGLEIKYVVDIIGILDITPVPKQESYIKGVFNLRGKIVPIMDIRNRFNQDEKTYDDRTCVVVVEIEGIVVGVIVDIVLDVVAIDDQDISTTESTDTSIGNDYIIGIAELESRSIVVLECVNLLKLYERGILKDDITSKAGVETA